jgi:hypothetical protein
MYTLYLLKSIAFWDVMPFGLFFNVGLAWSLATFHRKISCVATALVGAWKGTGVLLSAASKDGELLLLAVMNFLFQKPKF